MRKSLFLVLLTITFVGCGGNSTKTVVTPVKTNAFAFLQEVPYQSAMFTPMLGQYVSTSGDIQFHIAVATDASTGNPLKADFGSFYLAGDKVAFDLYGGIGDASTNQWDIYVAKADGSVITQITDDSYEDSYPQLSSDGSKVVFTSIREGELGMTNMIVIKNVTNPSIGEQILPMPLGAQETLTPTFSPDGTKIAVEAYGQNEANGSFDGLVLMNADGSNPQLLTNPYASCECWDGYPAFTPDGSKIVFSGGTTTANGDFVDVYIMNADGTGTPTQLTDGVGYNLDPLVIHVGGMADKIVFYSNRDNLSATASTGYELYSMNVDGTGLTRLTNNGLFDGFSQEWFQPQGSNAIASIGVRSRHGHRVGEQSPAQLPIRGLQW